MAHATSDAVWNVAWVTGSSSGIGKAVATLLARRGVKVAVSARSEDALEALALMEENIVAFPVDITDQAKVAQVVSDIEAQMGPIDLAVLNAGFWAPMGVDEFDLAAIHKSIDVNYAGTMNCVGALIGRMKERGRGHMALVSSVAGYRGLPQSLAYGPTKAALISFAESLKPDLERYGVQVSLITPGFVDTQMTSINDFDMPFIMQPEEAAQHIVAGLEVGRFEIAFPWQFVSIMKLLHSLPYGIYFWITRKMVEKRANKARAAKADQADQSAI
jgi:short-subunit dehydrogenase